MAGPLKARNNTAETLDFCSRFIVQRTKTFKWRCSAGTAIFIARFGTGLWLSGIQLIEHIGREVVFPVVVEDHGVLLKLSAAVSRTMVKLPLFALH